MPARQYGSPSRGAFTLVELLVVIGIIALLISILLPSLNKARAQANLVDCQARLRSMGEAMQIYTTENRQLLPWGVIQHGTAWENPSSFTPGPSNQHQYWWWFYTLSLELNRRAVDNNGYLHASGIFRDKDTVDGDTGFQVNHYTANPRVLYAANINDNGPVAFGAGTGSPILAKDRTQRKIASIKRSSQVFAIWDGPQLVDQQYSAYGVALQIDSYGMDNTGLYLDTASSQNNYGRAILPGVGGVSGRQDGAALQKTKNFDGVNYLDWHSHLRFRHSGNTMLAALCIDGHVETRRVGTVLVRDIYTNF